MVRARAKRRPSPNSAVAPPNAPPMAVPASRLVPPTNASIVPPTQALRDQRGDRLVDGAAGFRAQLAKGLQEAESLLERRGERVEVAHDAEILFQRPPPLRGMVLVADPVDQRHAGATGPAEDLHLGLVVAAERPRSVHHVEDVRPGEDGGEELPLVGELAGSLVRAEELGDARRAVRRRDLVRPPPGQRPPRVLES